MKLQSEYPVIFVRSTLKTMCGDTDYTTANANI